MATPSGSESVVKIHDELPRQSEPCVVAIGTFDGLHRGHQKILDNALEIGRGRSLPVAVLTFEPDPETVLNEVPPTERRLLTREDKMTILSDLGFDVVYEVEFDRSFASKAPEQFVDEVLVERLNARAVCVGYNFRFGHGREGNTELLRRRLPERDVALDVTPPVRYQGEPVSSTRIRQSVRQGRVKEARSLLGRPYTVHETLQAGEGRGRSIGFPTFNFPVTKTLHPRRGVYLVWLGTEKRRPSVANFGFHPTVGSSPRALLEVHVLDDPPPYEPGDQTHVYFGGFVREEREFDSVESLKQRIQRDVREARDRFKRLDRPHPLRPGGVRARGEAESPPG